MPNEDGNTGQVESFAPRTLSIDLEVSVKNHKIYKMAAVRGDTGEALVAPRDGEIQAVLRDLDEFSQGLAFLLGHNLIEFDVPHLIAARPNLDVLKLPRVDTLWLNPLAFPRNPYHRLVKHYQDGRIRGGQINNPELDARLALEVFSDQWHALRALRKSQPELLVAWHWLTTQDRVQSGVGSFFMTIRENRRPDDDEARVMIADYLKDRSCGTYVREVLEETGDHGWALAYALAWISVAGGNSVIPPWVQHQFPRAGQMVQRLRDTPCDDPVCRWCRERHDSTRELKRWFGYPDFRSEPTDGEGHPLQKTIVETAMRRQNVLGIMPTGAGKSVCYQLPALSRYDKTGALTVVISPLVALMADQVAGMEARGIGCCGTVNGMLSMPERSDVLDRVRLGDIGILIIAPEQLRNRAVRNALRQREIGAWVLDEAHCLSKWGHDFRPDYRYVGRFIRDRAGDGEAPPVLCLTATAKPEVIQDIVTHFQQKVGLTMRVLDGGSHRPNLDFTVVPTDVQNKLAHVYEVISHEFPESSEGGVIVYCSTRKNAENVAEYLRNKDISAEHFHAGLTPESKQDVQKRFIDGGIRVIAATNAFGMGIDKPDVRLVVHADIPGSLENYMQEAGRAGRDQQPARCVLMQATDDVERQFSMSARSRLTRREIDAILRSLRRLETKKHDDKAVVATSGEILAEEESAEYQRDKATDDTRVRTAISWLEESDLLVREENRVQVFPSSLRILDIEQAEKILARRIADKQYHKQLRSLVLALMDSDPDKGLSTDELMAETGLSSEGVRKALYDLEEFGIASNDTVLTAYVRIGIEDSSRKRLEETIGLEKALIDDLMEHAPDLSAGESSNLQLRQANQRLKNAGHNKALPDKLHRLLKSLAVDGRSEDGGIGSISLWSLGQETLKVTLQRNWEKLRATATLRREAAAILLEHLLNTLPERSRGKDFLAETTLGNLLAAINSDVSLRSRVKKPGKILDNALLWLHEQEVIRLHKGLTVFRPAMTIRLSHEKRGFGKVDFAPLEMHYSNQDRQIHIMAEYARVGLDKMADAINLVLDYFRLKQQDFLARWLQDQHKDLARWTTPESWQTIVEALNNASQKKIVTDEREQINVLVLAGPGSGKTRVLVHRIAFLIRARREHPRGVLALAYNRHAAVEIRRRLKELIGDDARGVMVLTCHALAMRLAGESLVDRKKAADNEYFRDILKRATRLLHDEDLPPEEADAQRERLLAGFRWILVDEYQDIGPEQYELISALAGRTLGEDQGKLTLFAVGDDDQNIYAFSGASVEFIQRFEQDYSARAAYLVENYRATGHLIDIANRIIAGADNRMKFDQPITINRARAKKPDGGRWAKIDPVGQGRAQCLAAMPDPAHQAVAVMIELQRLADLDPEWDWSTVAVIAREWKFLDPIRAYCEQRDIPVQIANEETGYFWQLRETRSLIDWLKAREKQLIDAAGIREWLTERPQTHWWDVVRESVDAYAMETGDVEMPREQFIEWLVEWGREMRRRQQGLLLLTAHRAKGLEFKHVAVLDGNWDRVGKTEDRDAPRRLYYVAVTRAIETLTLACLDGGNPLLEELPDMTSLQRRQKTVLSPPDEEVWREYRQLGPGDVDLGFAGRHPDNNAIHDRIRNLEPGDRVTLKRRNGKWMLLDDRSNVVGRLASKYEPPDNKRPVDGRVAAIIVRSLEQSDPQYQEAMKCDHWEVVLPEIVYVTD